MGTLVAWHYPTTTFAKLADHTYVACGTGGRAWSCWGGKTGGSALRQGDGSTLRADAIAEPNERAGITCYLVNGVCHQAANRILLPAGLTIRGAKGYWVSEALYGTYGRPRGFLGFCRAPFHQHDTINGDLPECVAAPSPTPAAPPAGVDVDEPGDAPEYLARVREIYRQADPGLAVASAAEGEARDFQLRLFETMVDFRLGAEYRETSSGAAAVAVRAEVEARRLDLEAAFFHHAIDVQAFVDEYNRLTEDYQYRTAGVLPEERYRKLFAEPPGETVVLGDPDVAKAAYPNR